MKKTMLMIAIAALAAGSALAREGNAEGRECPQGKKAWNHEDGGKPAWAPRDERRDERPGGPMSPEMMEQMRDDHQAIRKLGEAARSETDAAKKAELVAQLRAKLGEIADRMQAHQEERLAQAEERLAGLKTRIEEDKANRDAHIDEQVQRILSGERPGRPDAFREFPHAKGGMMRGPGRAAGGPGFAPHPEDAGDEEMPPPGEMPDELPPPPAE